MRLSLSRIDEATRTFRETWKPLPCSNVTRVRRFFDLQTGTLWRDLSELLPQVRGTVVDAGCGAQPYRRLFNAHVTYIGIDTAAASTFGYSTPETTYYDGYTWPLADASADTVLATETLEHVSDPRHFLEEAARVLRPGGSIILTAPFSARWHYIPNDFWRFTPSGLLQLLEEAGFADVRVFARGNSATVAAYKCLAILARFVLPQAENARDAFFMRLIGLVFLPVFVLVAIVGNASIAEGGDDCLGYTALASKALPAEPV